MLTRVRKCRTTEDWGESEGEGGGKHTYRGREEKRERWGGEEEKKRVTETWQRERL